jgi:uncharacterized cupin superfamily protein
MTLKYSESVCNAQLDAIETVVGASPVLVIRTGAAPANCAAADTGDVLATVQLPADWMAAASSASKAKSGTWEDTAADDTGTAGHWRIYEAGSPQVAHLQGDITVTGGGGDMTVNNTSFAAGQDFTVTSFTITNNNL